jgi:hypothetical protein
MTNIVGGTEYQHAHADQAWPLELEGERTFPFVATHGFGMNPFQMRLLAKSPRGKNEYGILHTYVIPDFPSSDARRFCTWLPVAHYGTHVAT